MKNQCKFNVDVQSAVSIIDNNDILLVNFADINDSYIFIEETQNDEFFTKNGNNSLGVGAIVGIIVSLLVVIALVTFLIFHFNKKDKKIIQFSDSTVIDIKTGNRIKF